MSTYPTTSQDSTQWTEAQSCLFFLEPKYSVALQIEVQQYKRQDTTWQHGGVYSAMYMYIFNSPLTLNMLALDAIPGTVKEMQCYFKINYRRSSEVSHAKLVQRFAPLDWR